MKVSISTIKDWFRNGLRPTQTQFWATWDSFWHKDEQIPFSSIENIQENLDEKLDVEVYENEKANFQNTSFKNVGDGTPNVDTTMSAYREGKIGVGEPDPIETVDVIGSGKFQYTYSDGSIARATLGGENTNSEIGLPSGLIKTNTLAFFPDQSAHPGTQGYFYTGDISSLVPASGKLSTGMGIASLTNTKYARSAFFPYNNNGNPESEYVGVFEARHEDGNATAVQVFNKGGELGKKNEAYLVLRASVNHTETVARITLSPRIATVEGALLQLKEYADDTLIEGYVHNDDEATTGTAATTIGALKPLGVDSDGNVGKILTGTSEVTASNGVTETSGDIKLGGNLIEETIIETDTNLFRVGNTQSDDEGGFLYSNGMTINGNDITFKQSVADVIELTDDTTIISKFNRDLIIGMSGIIFDTGFSSGRSVDFVTPDIRFAINNGSPRYYAIFDFLGSEIEDPNSGFRNVTYLFPKRSGRIALVEDFPTFEGYSETGTVLGGDLVSTIGSGPDSTLILEGLPIHADETAAIAASLITGTVYMTATGELRIKL
ncbi:hypothetical protein [Dokdonia sp.]|uniref:hypothetical protein n=1 Tax=Dokdonia sp. TaxID=2024995 RepID=UPI003264812B